MFRLSIVLTLIGLTASGEFFPGKYVNIDTKCHKVIRFIVNVKLINTSSTAIFLSEKFQEFPLKVV